MKLNIGAIASSIEDYGLLATYELIRVLEASFEIKEFSKEERSFTWDIDGDMFELHFVTEHARLPGTITFTQVNKALDIFSYKRSVVTAVTALSGLFNIQRVVLGEGYTVIVFTKDGLSLMSLKVTAARRNVQATQATN